jgi:formate hydrogenlyase transcriptional activator
MFFIQRHAKRIGRIVEGVSRESMERLTRYQWPGNVRELENVIERALVLSRSHVLDVGRDFLPALPAEAPAPVVTQVVPMPVEAPLPVGTGTLEDIERAHIAATLERTGWVVEGPRGAARILDMHPNTLRSRMKKLGLQRTARHDISEPPSRAGL